MHMGFPAPPSFFRQIHDPLETDRNIGGLGVAHIELSICGAELRPALHGERVPSISEIESRVAITHEMIIPKRKSGRPLHFSRRITQVNPPGHRLLCTVLEDRQPNLTRMKRTYRHKENRP